MRVVGKILKWLLGLIVVAVVGAAIWLWTAPPALIRVAANYTAKIVCSNVFLAGRDADEVLAVDVQAPGHPILKLMMLNVDKDAGTVSAGLLGIFGKGEAVLRPGLGCANVPDGNVAAAKAISTDVSAPPAVPDALWPEGRRVEPSQDPDVTKILDDASLTGPGMRAVVVVQNGRIVGERYGTGFSDRTPLLGWSMTKSVNAAIVGTLIKEGKLAITDQGLFPDWKADKRAAITLADMMAMSSGLEFNEDYGDLSSDIVRYIIRILTGSVNDFTAHLKNERPQGTFNRYVSADTQVLGMVLEGATGKPLPDYFKEKLWSRLGPEADAYWLVDQKHETLAAGGLNAVLRDYARFGLLYLNEGRNWKGEQIVPAKWVQASVTPDAPHLMPGREDPAAGIPFGYGYQWWIPGKQQGDFTAIGIYGQFIYVNPARKVVIAKTSAYVDYNNSGNAMEYEAMDAFQAIANAL